MPSSAWKKILAARARNASFVRSRRPVAIRMLRGGRLVFFNDTATTEIYTLSLHDALPISLPEMVVFPRTADDIVEILKIAAEHKIPIVGRGAGTGLSGGAIPRRSEEHTSELQSQSNIGCRLLLGKKYWRPGRATLHSSVPGGQ